MRASRDFMNATEHLMRAAKDYSHEMIACLMSAYSPHDLSEPPGAQINDLLAARLQRTHVSIEARRKFQEMAVRAISLATALSIDCSGRRRAEAEGAARELEGVLVDWLVHRTENSADLQRASAVLGKAALDCHVAFSRIATERPLQVALAETYEELQKRSHDIAVAAIEYAGQVMVDYSARGVDQEKVRETREAARELTRKLIARLDELEPTDEPS